MQTHIRKVYACLPVTCHLHFWQNDRGLLRATAVTRGWNGYRNKSQHRKSTLEKKILPPLLQGFEPATFNHESGALTTELSPPLLCCFPFYSPLLVSVLCCFPCFSPLLVNVLGCFPCYSPFPCQSIVFHAIAPS